jgi:hypothetical protein
MILFFADGYEDREVLAIGEDNDEFHKQPGITTTNGWCALGYYAKEYVNLPQNTELTAYCKLHYPEYFI